LTGDSERLLTRIRWQLAASGCYWGPLDTGKIFHGARAQWCPSPTLGGWPGSPAADLAGVCPPGLEVRRSGEVPSCVRSRSSIKGPVTSWQPLMNPSS
jgi:hypothetical protein